MCVGVEGLTFFWSDLGFRVQGVRRVWGDYLGVFECT